MTQDGFDKVVLEINGQYDNGSTGCNSFCPESGLTVGVNNGSAKTKYPEIQR